LQKCLLLALWAGERAKRWAAFSGHGVKIWVGTDKMNESESRLMGNSLKWT